MDLHPVDVIISIINITILFILLRLILWKHVIKFLNKRAAGVAGEMEDAKKQRLEAEALRSEYTEKFGDIEERGQELMRESRMRANKESEKIIAETRERAKVMIQDAELRIEEERKQALEESQMQVAELAADMAAQILGREVSALDNVNAVNDFFEE